MSEASILEELRVLGWRLLEGIEGFDTIGGFHVKENWLTERFSNCDKVWCVRSHDTRLEIYNVEEVRTPIHADNRNLIVEFNGFGDVAKKGYNYDLTDAVWLLNGLRRVFILDVLADV